MDLKAPKHNYCAVYHYKDGENFVPVYFQSKRVEKDWNLFCMSIGTPTFSQFMQFIIQQEEKGNIKPPDFRAEITIQKDGTPDMFFVVLETKVNNVKFAKPIPGYFSEASWELVRMEECKRFFNEVRLQISVKNEI